MNTRRVEELLRQYAKLLPEERVFSEQAAAALRERLSKTIRGRRRVDVGAYGPEDGELGARHARGRRRGEWRTLAAVVAAVLIAAVLPVGSPPSAAPALQVDGAYSQADLFRTTRGESAGLAEGNMYYIGVRVTQPAYVRIVVLDDRGRLDVLELDRRGAEEVRLLAGAGKCFGGYDIRAASVTGAESNVTAFVIIAATRPLDAWNFADALAAANRTGAAPAGFALQRFERDLHRRFGCIVRVVRP